MLHMWCVQECAEVSSDMLKGTGQRSLVTSFVVTITYTAQLNDYGQVLQHIDDMRLLSLIYLRCNKVHLTAVSVLFNHHINCKPIEYPPVEYKQTSPHAVAKCVLLINQAIGASCSVPEPDVRNSSKKLSSSFIEGTTLYSISE